MPPKPRFPPLTRDQLRELWQRAPIAGVRRLLREIHRLRALVLRANDFVRMATYYKAEQRMDTTSRGLLEAARVAEGRARG
jgi:hypothetical protein